MPVSIDGRGRSTGSSRHLLELHEDEIPEFQKTIAVLVGGARRPATDLVALVVEDLGVIATRSDRPHRPQIVGMVDDAVIGQARDLAPQAPRLSSSDAR